MVMVLNKKIKRTMTEHKSKFIGSFVLITISCMLYIAFNLSTPSIKNGIERYFENNRVEDAYFIVQNNLYDIRGIESRFNLILEERGMEDYKLTDDTTLRILEETSKLNRYSLIEGRPIANSNEILIDREFARANDLYLGSTIEIYNRNFYVVGFFAAPDYIFPLKSEADLVLNPKAFGVSVVSEKAYKRLKNKTTFYSVKFNENNIEEFKKYLKKDNTILKWSGKEENPRITNIDGTVESFVQVGRFVPVNVLILTCVLIAVVLWRILKEEFVQIGTFYALGYRKQEILRHYLSYPVILALSGSMAGLAPGILLARPIAGLLNFKYNMPVINIDYNIKYIFISIVLPFIFLIPTTILVAMKALTMPPLVLIRGGGNKTKVSALEKRVRLNRFKFNTKFRLRDIIRNIPSTIFMILGVTFASMLLLFGFVTRDSLDYLMEESYNQTYLYNYEYVFKTLKEVKRKSAERMSLSTFTVEKDGKSLNSIVIYGVERDSELIMLKDAKGKDIDKNNHIITLSLAKKLNIQEGDSINVKNKHNLEEFTIKIDKIADSHIGDFIFIPIDEFNRLCKYPKNSYIKMVSRDKLDVNPDELLSEISKEDVLAGYESMLSPIKYMVGIVAVMAFVIGLIVIYIVTSMIIEENKNNVSLLKVLGYSDKRIFSLITGSNAFLVVIGYALSLPLIFPVMDKLFETMSSSMNITIPTKLNNINLFISFVIIYITFEVSKFISKRKVSAISIADSLKNRIE